MNIISRQNQRAAYSLNQSMTNGLPVLTPENTNLCTSQFYGRKYTNKIYDSPNNEIQSGRQHILYQKDIEQLKEEIIQLKKENTRLKDLNKQLQFQIKLDEKEQIDKGTTQEVSEDQINYNQSSRLVEKLKQARMLLQERQTEIENLKKSTRYMKLQEMEMELGNTKTKFEILNKQFNEILKTENDFQKFNKLTNQTVELEEKVRILSNSNQKQKRKILCLRQELLTCQAMRDRYKKQFEQCQNEFGIYRKNYEQDIQKKIKYKEIIDNLNQQKANQQTIISQMQMEIEKQKLLVFQKQKQLKELEDQYQIKKSLLTNKREADTSFQEALDEKVNKNFFVFADVELSNSLKQQSETKIILEEDHRDKSFIIQNRLSVDSVREDSKSPQIQSFKIIPDVEISRQRLPRVNHCDVEEIGKKLKYQLMSQLIPFESINRFFESKQEMSILELVEVLQASPFCIQQQKQALLLARYLIEDNTQPYVEFTPLQTGDNCVIKSVFKNIVGKYQLFDIEQQNQIMFIISQQIWKFRQSIVEQIKIMSQKKTNSQYSELCNEMEFKNAIQGSNILLDDRQKEFLGFFIYKQFDGSKLFDYKILIDKFGNQNSQNSPSKSNPQGFQ
ncbi:unnamed protein product [Paramecium sonneborni]|uniref:Uncharacterized protein n=1 Tax=Paramecium sonneborni TaxID=65129 RepID=A0A8S1NX22_9CILI|nr:unnamed protein product [Paramecium sonneborni]